MHLRGPISTKPFVIHIEAASPVKPPAGAACNGCGVCCAVEPCPLGIVLFRQRRGPCPGLVWEPQARLYRCGVLSAPQKVAKVVLPAWLRFAEPALTRTLAWGASRWIAAGVGCDCSLEVVPSPLGAPHNLEKQP
jgi:hypothetical protein